jgi:hypothetical protein
VQCRTAYHAIACCSLSIYHTIHHHTQKNLCLLVVCMYLITCKKRQCRHCCVCTAYLLHQLESTCPAPFVNIGTALTTITAHQTQLPCLSALSPARTWAAATYRQGRAALTSNYCSRWPPFPSAAAPCATIAPSATPLQVRCSALAASWEVGTAATACALACGSR